MFYWMVHKYDISTKPNVLVRVLLNAPLKDDDDIYRQRKSLYCAVNEFRGTSVRCAKPSPYLAYSCINIRFFVFQSVFWLIRVLVLTPELLLLGILSLDWNFWPFLGIFSDLGIFRKVWKCVKMNYFSLFCKSYLVLFLTFIMALRLCAAPPHI